MGLVQLIRPSSRRPDLEVMRSTRPVRNPAVTSLGADDGSLVLTAPLASMGSGLIAILVRRMNLPETKQFELDPVGAFVWEQCDGRTSFSTIVSRLRSKFKMNRLEAEASLAAYLQTLNRRRLVTVVTNEGKRRQRADPVASSSAAQPLSPAREVGDRRDTSPACGGGREGASEREPRLRCVGEGDNRLRRSPKSKAKRL